MTTNEIRPAPNSQNEAAEAAANSSHATIDRVAILEQQLSKALRDSEKNTILQNKVVGLETEIAKIHASASWRITAPLRSVMRLVSAIRLAVQTIRRQEQARGGLYNVMSYYLSVIRREGFNGIHTRLARLRNGAGFASGLPSDEAYEEWIRRFDTITDEGAAQIRLMTASLKEQPLISIVVPTYNSNTVFLSEMIESVKAQIYPHWELCIADDASTNPSVRRLLQDAAEQDKRIMVSFRSTNGHISEASNTALAAASGKFVALLDHDDLLAPHALFMVARYINRYPHAQLFYSDEDKLNEDGKRTTPYFKSDWNPEMFLTQNMFSHLGVFETDLVRKVGGFRKGFEGSQDYDLTLRCVEVAGHDKVVHIPHILYHWRMAPGSTAGSSGEKPYAHLAAMKAVQEHFDRQRVHASLEKPVPNLPVFRVRYALLQPEPRVSIIIPTRDGLTLLQRCISSIQKKTVYKNYEIIIVDNGSVKGETLDYFENIRKSQNVRIVRDDSPFNFSALNNNAAATASGDYLCLLNNDIEVISPDWLNEMVSLAARPGNGAIGARLWYPNDTLQHGGVILGLGGIAGHMHPKLTRGELGYFGRAVTTQNLSAVTAACLVISKNIYNEAGGFNEELAVAFNDVDFCLRVRELGYHNVWTPYAELYHHESATRGNDMDPDKYQRFLTEIKWMEDRWRGHFDSDPAYNPNLSLSTEVQPFTLAVPPRVDQFD